VATIATDVAPATLVSDVWWTLVNDGVRLPISMTGGHPVIQLLPMMDEFETSIPGRGKGHFPRFPRTRLPLCRGMAHALARMMEIGRNLSVTTLVTVAGGLRLRPGVKGARNRKGRAHVHRAVNSRTVQSVCLAQPTSTHSGGPRCALTQLRSRLANLVKVVRHRPRRLVELRPSLRHVPS
jgi:hypothetical protein